MFKAAIDIGSNSMLLLIIEKKSDGNFKEVADESRVTALGKDLDLNKVFCESSMAASRKAFSDFEKTLTHFKIATKDVIVTATEASRVALNAKIFFDEIKDKHGFLITTINGEGEAFYTAKGVMKGLSDQDEVSVIMDIGGASTELILIDRTLMKIKESISLPIGSVRANDWLNTSKENFDQKLQKILKTDNTLNMYKAKKLVCVAGTMTSIGAMVKQLDEYQSKVVHNLIFNRSDFDALISTLPEDSSILLRSYPYLGKRAKTIKAGALVAQEIADKLCVETFEISTYGLRYGVVLSEGIDDEFKILQ
jgi:exopolyphosphatase/guanosine-5'-triphosphate,3'-diphosphate pyrophosphatase